jgi:nitrogen regulatory protein P-II 1
MKAIVAIVSPVKVDGMKKALNKKGIEGMTVFDDAKGIGRHHAAPGNAANDFLPRSAILVLVDEKKFEDAFNTMSVSARSEKADDGIVFSFAIEGILRISSGESGHDFFDRKLAHK